MVQGAALGDAPFCHNALPVPESSQNIYAAGGRHRAACGLYAVPTLAGSIFPMPRCRHRDSFSQSRKWSAMQDETVISLEGTVETVIFRNEDTGFTVIELDYGGQLLTAVGVMSGICEGERVSLLGQYTTHPSYGTQFRAEAVERTLPSSANAIGKYLASGAIKGVGPALAARLVAHFGDKTLEIMENQPELLSQVRGISPKKAEEIGREFSRLFSIRAAMLFLSKYSLTAAQSIRVWKLLGEETIPAVQQNPYIVCAPDTGVSFQQADSIAQKLELDMKNPVRISAAAQYSLRHNTHNGHTCLPLERLVAQLVKLLDIEPEQAQDIIEQDIEIKALQREIIHGREYIYLPHLYAAEVYIAQRIRLMQELILPDAQSTPAIDELERDLGLEYAPMQRRAIEHALKSSAFILTGGPGTGKTTTLNAIITLYERKGMRVALTAPTGRAAKRMSELTGRSAQTIHRLLEAEFDRVSGLHIFRRNEKNPLSADVVVIDEMSMVDVPLMESLLRGIRMNCRLIAVGDTDQLPSVGCGNVLRDLIASDVITTVRLDQVFRQAADSLIVTNAHSIVKGEEPELCKKDSDFFFLRRASFEDGLSTVLELCAARLPKAYGYSPFTDIQVLSASRKGALGTEQLNAGLQNTLNPHSPEKSEYTHMGKTLREGDKVMQIRNNYDIVWKSDAGEQGAGVFNGDIGTIELIDRPSQSLLIRYEDRIAEYAFDLCDELELAYAVTVHKSQGSEFEAVIIPVMGFHSRLHYRNLLYTAVTRAKRLLILVGSEKTIRDMIGNDRKTLRFTGLQYFLESSL